MVASPIRLEPPEPPAADPAARARTYAVPVYEFAIVSALLVGRLWATAPHLGGLSLGARALAIVALAIEEVGLFASVFLAFLALPGQPRALRTALGVTFCFLYVTDLELLHGLAHRLSLVQTGQFLRHPVGALLFLGPVGSLLVGAGLAIVLGAGVYIRRRFRRELSLTRAQAATGLVALAALAALPWLEQHRALAAGVDYSTLNLVRINTMVTVRRGFDPDAVPDLAARHPEAARAVDALFRAPPPPAAGAERPSHVVLVVSESLSRIDSLRSGKLLDRLPRIDRVQAEGLTLTNVIADGETTSDALVSLFTGLTPMPSPVVDDSVIARYPFRFPGPPGASPPSLAQRARSAGYRPVFLSNAPLSFQDDGAWIDRLGFEEVVDGRSPVFAGARRLVFDSPPDELLYAEAIARLRSAQSPLFLVLLTISLHAPYQLPDERDRVPGPPLLSQLGYVDRTTAAFFEELRALGVTDRGLFAIVGDHRRMAALEPDEVRTLGFDAQGRVLASLVGRGVERGATSDALINQSDMMAMVGDAMEGRALRPVAEYNRGARLGLGVNGAIEVLLAELGQIVIRREGAPPLSVRLSRRLDPATVTSDPGEQRLLAFALLEAARIEAAQLAP